jgi:hypothetical protein
MRYITVNIVAEFCCLLISILTLRKDKIWRPQILYLFLIVLTESLGRFLTKGMHIANNSWLYNIFLIIELIFVGSMFYILLKPRTALALHLLIGLISLFSLSYLYDLWVHGMIVFNSTCNGVISVCYSILALFYFYVLIRGEDYVDILRFAPFWWVAGAMVYYFGSSACNLYLEVLVSLKDHTLRRYLLMSLNVFLYSSWSYAFICQRWFTKI